MNEKKTKFLSMIDARNSPNSRDKVLFLRAERYIDKIKNIRGIKMIAICNSLSMFATKKDSDIDLFIVTDPKMLWYTRFWITFYFWRWGVWRKWSDVASNFCLSFFVTDKALDLSKIAISDDIYLYFWVYFLRPILDYDDTYEKFLQENSWVKILEDDKNSNRNFIKISGKSKKIYKIHIWMNHCIRFFGEKKTRKNFEKMGRPKGVIISRDMLKFHDKDQRKNFKKSFENNEKFKKNF